MREQNQVQTRMGGRGREGMHGYAVLLPLTHFLPLSGGAMISSELSYPFSSQTAFSPPSPSVVFLHAVLYCNFPCFLLT